MDKVDADMLAYVQAILRKQGVGRPLALNDHVPDGVHYSLHGTHLDVNRATLLFLAKGK